MPSPFRWCSNESMNSIGIGESAWFCVGSCVLKKKKRCTMDWLEGDRARLWDRLDCRKGKKSCRKEDGLNEAVRARVNCNKTIVGYLNWRWLNRSRSERPRGNAICCTHVTQFAICRYRKWLRDHCSLIFTNYLSKFFPICSFLLNLFFRSFKGTNDGTKQSRNLSQIYRIAS